MTSPRPSSPTRSAHTRLPTSGRRVAFRAAGILSICLCILPLPSCAPAPTPAPKGVTYTRSGPVRPNLARPVAQSAQPLSRTTSRLAVALRPLGSVPFDGITLPLTSPNGHFIAAQHGPTQSWDALLASPSPEGAAVPVQLRIDAFRVAPPEAVVSGESALKPVTWTQPLPTRLLIGRSCDDQGFLVEYPRPESRARWIGKVDWLTGSLAWLVAPSDEHASAVACFGSFGPSGELAFCRASSPGEPFDLVVRTVPQDSATESILHPPLGATFACPTFSADRDRLYVFLVSSASDAKLALLAVDLPSEPGSPPVITARVEFDVAPSIAAAYQSTLVLQTPWPAPDGGAPSGAIPVGLALASPVSASMCWFDPVRAKTIALARGTLGAAPLLTSTPAGVQAWTGLLLGAARELVFQSCSPGAPPEFGSDAAVVAGAFLPRLTTNDRDGAHTYLLLSPPMPTDPPNVGIFELAPMPTP